MRLFFAGFLMAGLLFTALSVAERRGSPTRREPASPMITSEDGTPIPQPGTKPKTR